MGKSEFLQGYACAVSMIVRSHGSNTDTREALEAVGLTSLKELRMAGVDPVDVEALMPLISEIQYRERFKKKGKRNG